MGDMLDLTPRDRHSTDNLTHSSFHRRIAGSVRCSPARRCNPDVLGFADLGNLYAKVDIATSLPLITATCHYYSSAGCKLPATIRRKRYLRVSNDSLSLTRSLSMANGGWIMNRRTIRPVCFPPAHTPRRYVSITHRAAHWIRLLPCKGHGFVKSTLTKGRWSLMLHTPASLGVPMKRAGVLGLLVIWSLLMGERSALAYVDPNTGSMLLQVVLGGAAGLVLIVELLWRRVLSVLGLRSDERNRNDHAKG